MKGPGPQPSRSKGNGGWASGLTAMDRSRAPLSSAAVRLELSEPHSRHRWTIAHSPPFRTHTAIGSIMPPQSAALSPGTSSRCTLQRHRGQWFRCSVPPPVHGAKAPQDRQVNPPSSLESARRCIQSAAPLTPASGLSCRVRRTALRRRFLSSNGNLSDNPMCPHRFTGAPKRRQKR